MKSDRISPEQVLSSIFPGSSMSVLLAMLGMPAAICFCAIAHASPFCHLCARYDTTGTMDGTALAGGFSSSDAGLLSLHSRPDGMFRMLIGFSGFL